MALTQTPKSDQVKHWIAADSAVDKTGFKNIRAGQAILHDVELVGGSTVMSWKGYDHNGSGLVHGTTLADFIFPVASSGRSHYKFVEGVQLDNGLSWAGSQEDGITFTNDPTGTRTARLTGRRMM